VAVEPALHVGPLTATVGASGEASAVNVMLAVVVQRVGLEASRTVTV